MLCNMKKNIVISKILYKLHANLKTHIDQAINSVKIDLPEYTPQSPCQFLYHT